MPKISEVKYADVPEDEHLRIAENFLEVTAQHSSILKHAINGYRDVSLKDYLKALQPNLQKPYQGREDLIGIVHDHTKALLGDVVAAQTASDLSKNPIILTANCSTTPRIPAT